MILLQANEVEKHTWKESEIGTYLSETMTRAKNSGECGGLSKLYELTSKLLRFVNISLCSRRGVWSVIHGKGGAAVQCEQSSR